MDENGAYQMQTSYMKSYIADDGTVHLVADSTTIREQIKALDLDRARMLAFVADFWLGRVKELTPAVQTLLGVKAVWCDTKTEQNSQKFVIWAGYLLEKRWVEAAGCRAAWNRHVPFFNWHVAHVNWHVLLKPYCCS